MGITFILVGGAVAIAAVIGKTVLAFQKAHNDHEYVKLSHRSG